MNIENYIKNKEIVSYDDNKTWIEESNDIIYFYKKGTQEEYDNQVNIKLMLDNKRVIVNEKEYEISCPQVYDINDGIIKMEYFDGVNLETILKNDNKHKSGVLFLNKLITFFVENKIYWVDFAPRNILISNKKIMIVDFEKGIMNKNEKLEEYLLNHVFEEYNLFLLKEERLFNSLNIYNFNEEKNNIKINVDSIQSIRHKCLAKLLGHNETILYREYLDIIKLIIEVEEPYINEQKIVYPGVILDKLIQDNIDKNPIELYSKEVLKLSKKINKMENIASVVE